MNNLFVKKGDTVLLLAGKNKGKTGKVLSVEPVNNTVVVDGRNIIVKHIKPRGAQSAGGIQKVPGPVDASNVQVVCPSCSKATRVASGAGSDGKKIRVCKKCGASLDVKVKAEKKTAKRVKKDDAPAEEAAITAKTEEKVKKTVKKTVKSGESKE